MRRGFLLFLMVSFQAPSSLFAQGYIGVYADSMGTIACVEIDQYTYETLYVIGRLEDQSSSGIMGAEFRIEVSEPDGWLIGYSPPASASLSLGNPVDLLPESLDTSGVILAFSTCQVDSSGMIQLGTISATNLYGEPSLLSVKKHSTPSNINYPCPHFILCDIPYYTKVCMEVAGEQGCVSGLKLMDIVASDYSVFSAGLDITEHLAPEVVEAMAKPQSPRAVTWRSPPADIVSEHPLFPEKASRATVVLADTTWLANWSFDNGICDLEGWTSEDNRLTRLTADDIPWVVNDSFDGVGFDGVTIDGDAAILGESNSCWVTTGYGDDWDFAIQVEYEFPQGGAPHLQFDMLLDTSSPDGILIETDSLGLSQSINYDLDPSLRPRDLRHRQASFVGLGRGKSVDVPLRDYGPGIHHVLIRFVSDYDISAVDNSEYTLGAGVVVDNLSVTENNLVENFSGELDPRITFVVSGDSALFGAWGRLYPGIPDNDDCPNNLSCAWLFTDNTTPTFSNDASQAFGPGGYVIKNWLDDIIVSPWVSVQQTQGRTILSFRELGGNTYQNSKIGRAVNVRGKTAGGCVGRWGDIESDPITTNNWYERVDNYYWETKTGDVSHLLGSEEEWDQIQMRYRVSDAQLILKGWAGPPVFHIPGPGPFVDDIRIGRIPTSKPILSVGVLDDSKFLAQDRFADDGSIHGTSSFSMAGDIAADQDVSVQPGDSIVIWVDSPPLEFVTGITLYGAIVSGPHQGKAPPPFTVGGNGFFVVPADTCRNIFGNPKVGEYFVELDDEYFRGGDVLQYFWFVASTGENESAPAGIDQVPLSIAAAQAATGGLFEVNYLPVIDWDQSFLDRIAADSHGKLEPTSMEVMQSSQRNCILYVNQVNRRRRSGDLNRTSFMYTLDRLGYAYDIYDVTGEGNTFSELASRSTDAQALGYSIIVHDAGPDRFAPLPDGDFDSGWKVDQDEWYVQWLENNVVPGDHLLWLIGENLVETHPQSWLLQQYMGVQYAGYDRDPEDHPNIVGIADMTFSQGGEALFDGDSFSLAYGCTPEYDVLAVNIGTPTPNAKVTHAWGIDEASATGGAIVMNAITADHPRKNMITMAFNWSDIAFLDNDPAGELVLDIFQSLQACEGSGSTTEAAGDVPLVSRLFESFPNPSNPITNISFDLSSMGMVTLKVFDVRGRLVRTLVNEPLEPNHYSYIWDGRNDSGVEVSSGVYLYRIQSVGFDSTRKLVMIR